jgi:uncharacterized protein YjgD (DUF1641 family)
MASQGLLPQDSWSKFAARTTKSLAAGVGGGLIDAATSLYNIPAALTNAQKETLKDVDPRILGMGEAMGGMPAPIPGQADLPLIPSAVEAIDKGVDQATDDYTRTPNNEKWFQEGLKLGASIAAGGAAGAMAGKARLKGTEAVLKTAGSTKPSSIAAAAMEKAHESGMSQPASIGTGIGAAVATEAAASLLNPKNIAKGVMKSVGLGKGQLKRDALESAERLGVDLPAAAATDSKLMAFLNQHASKIPFVGDILREKFQTASTQYQSAFKSLLEDVGAVRDEGLNQKINALYAKSHALIPERDILVPKHSLKALQDVRKKIKSTVYSEPTQKLVSKLDEMEKSLLLDGSFAIPMPVQEIVNWTGVLLFPCLSRKSLIRRKNSTKLSNGTNLTPMFLIF